MHIGMQLHAPDGFRSLSKSIRYYFAGRRESDGAGLLIWFEKSGKQRRVRFIRLTGSEFECALLEEPRHLLPEKKQYTLPEWLHDVEGISFEEIEELRYKKKKETYREQVERNFSHIVRALGNKNEILSAANPLKELAKYAYQGETHNHPHRIQLWFFSYILHADNIWALKGSCNRNGKWSRAEGEHADKKFGRPSLTDGSMYGWSSAQMREKIEDSYLRHCGLGVRMSEIYSRALAEDFGCKVRRLESGKYQLYHPDNLPFPSYGQFRYVVVRKYGLRNVQVTVLGQPRVRSNAKQNDGNFTRPYANLLESLVVDAYHVKDRPRSFRSNDPMPPLIVARGICVTTSAVVGVGFSLGAETGDAYRSMLFCMAVPKKYFARLVGIPADALDWIMEGLPPSFTSDRGPGASKNLIKNLEVAFQIKSIGPSYSGQSNAVAESSHPRSINLEGAPSFIQSDLDVVALMKREVFRAALDNHTSDISGRLDDEAIREFRRLGWTATPHNYWKYLHERLRTSGHSIPIEDAVRSFCTPIPLDVDCQGVRYRSSWFSSEEFRATGIQSEVANLSNFKLPGFVLSMMARYVWVEVRGRLIEVEAMLRVRGDTQDLYKPISELDQKAEDLSVLKSRTRQSAVAADVDARVKFKAITGQSWDAGHRRAGSPKKATGTTRQEAKILGGTSDRRKAE